MNIRLIFLAFLLGSSAAFGQTVQLITADEAIQPAAAPAGEHPIRVTVRDSEGRLGTAEFKLTVK